jgi:hypothetical protein
MYRSIFVTIYYFLSLAAFLVPLEGMARDLPMYLVCTYTHTVDDKGSAPTSGEKLITVTQLKNMRVEIKMDGLGARFSGTISSDEIRGETEYEIQDRAYRQTLNINRYTGEFTNSFSVGRTNDGLIHFGKCKRVSGPQF